MLAKVYTCAVVGLEGRIIEVEVDISPGLPAVTVVGLGDKAVQESRERVRAAIRNCGCDFPMRRVTVNLAPADLKKEGPSYDLSIAVGVLLSTGQVSSDLSDTVLLGELALDGGLRHTNGILPMVDLARQQGFRRVVVPEADAREAALVAGIDVLPANSLAELVAHLWGDAPIAPLAVTLTENMLTNGAAAFPIDLQDIKGQEHAKFALEVAAAGGHNVLMMGPPGSGKTLLARSHVLDPAQRHAQRGPGGHKDLQHLRFAAVRRHPSWPRPGEVTQRPFRVTPLHHVPRGKLVGSSGHWPRPGEVTLAAQITTGASSSLTSSRSSGRACLRCSKTTDVSRRLRTRPSLAEQTISRAQGRVTFPANFMLVGAMNPCPCGYYGDPFRACTCAHSAVVGEDDTGTASPGRSSTASTSSCPCPERGLRDVSTDVGQRRRGLGAGASPRRDGECGMLFGGRELQRRRLRRVSLRHPMQRRHGSL